MRLKDRHQRKFDVTFKIENNKSGDELKDPLRERVNEIRGVENFKLKLEEKDGVDIDGTEVAVISFWRLNNENLFRCIHSIEAPNPMKR